MRSTMDGENMKDEYDLSKMESRKNPYAERLNKKGHLPFRGVIWLQYNPGLSKTDS